MFRAVRKGFKVDGKDVDGGRSRLSGSGVGDSLSDGMIGRFGWGKES